MHRKNVQLSLTLYVSDEPCNVTLSLNINSIDSVDEQTMVGTGLAICSHCILSICNIYLVHVLVLRAGCAF